MSDEGEEVRYSERDPARTRRGSDDRGADPTIEGGENVHQFDREREREREIQKSSSFFYLFFLLPSSVGWKKCPFGPPRLPPKKSSALVGLSFLSIN